MSKQIFKIATVLGARPQFIKAALVSQRIRRFCPQLKEVIIHTGQHYDYRMSDVFFKELSIPEPDYNLKVKAASHGGQVAKMLIGVEKVLMKERPGLVLVYGDTNSTLAGALAGAKLAIPVAHVEAGLRSFNKSMPEEVNRTVTDRVSDIFLCPTQTAVANLAREGITSGVFNVGDPMYDVFKKFTGLIKPVSAKQRYILATIHRQENTDTKENLKNIFRAFALIKERILIPLHPRTRKAVKKNRIALSGNITVLPPLSYFQMLLLEKNASVIITDSGGVQKEAFMCNVPCVTLRNETEWVETLESGMNKIAGASVQNIIKAVNVSLRMRPPKGGVERFYGDGFAYKRIPDILLREIKKRVPRGL